MSAGAQDLELFRRIGLPGPFREWVERERAAQVKFLTTAVEAHTVHRAQGQIAVYDKLLGLVEAARNPR